MIKNLFGNNIDSDKGCLNYSFISIENIVFDEESLVLLIPDLFNVSRITTLPQIAMLAAARNKHLELRFSDKDYLMQWQSSLNGNPLARECISIE